MTEEQIREAAANYTKENWTQISRVQDLLIRDGYVSGASSLLPKIKELEEELRKFHIEIYHAAKGYSEMTSILNGQLGDAMALNKVEDIIAETSKKKRQSKSEISKLEEQNRVMREALEAIKCMISPIDYDGMGLHIGATRMLAITSLAKVN